ncbi:lytic murein transglycosylase [Roseitranquillus sediminis]|uniref:lytic murein transglycosylase n=1 Tax=Roseitranquillus sediminis TaxID=2809051 RepID=UPI001D0C98BF|nr:lytic murein transglycosylase [Roseitranquillus sediminis]MBM9593638.1 lytic murein transglycosylase [Roseitranquillus sediminis]
MHRILLLAAALALPLPSAAQVACGGDFGGFVQRMAAEARARGFDQSTVGSFFAGVRQDPAVIRADRAQGVFQLPFIDFSRRLISQNRLQNGARMAQRYDAVFDQIEQRYGVSRGVLLAFWAFETDFGQVQGDFNTVNALMTLAHDCRRPDLFRPQVFAALELYRQGALDPAQTQGAWAGEIGMVQMLPSEIIEKGVDADGDGRVDLKGSATDALFTGAAVLRSLGWRPNEPWLQEVTLPASFDWAQTGLDVQRSGGEWARLGVQPRWGSITNLPASVLLPQGRGGPAFLAYPNFNVLFEWNRSFVYVTTAAYFATRLEGAPVYAAGNPSPALSEGQMRQLQQKLAARGHDVGGIDGILGAMTRSAVQAEQRRLGLPADAWPTPELLQRL